MKNYKIMHRKVILIIFILVVLLFSGCVQTQTQPYDSQTGSRQQSSYPAGLPSTSKCGNGLCETGEDSSNCCLDCGCPSGYTCDMNSCKKLAECGNGILEEGENSENCCLDAGCPTGETCQNNVCIVLKPEISASFWQTTESYSVTYLKAKGSGVGDIILNNKGNDDALDVKVVLSSPNGFFADKTINFGIVHKNAGVKKTADLTFLEKVLDVTTDEDITIKAIITCSNSANKQHASEESFNMRVAGRNYMTWSKPAMVASWVTPTQPIVREFASKATAGLPAGMSSSSTVVQKMAARWLFESMRSYGIKYVNDAHSTADYVQFPYETLKNKAGDCDDHAIFYASLLESIGMKAFLMLVPGHIFSGYIDSDGYAVPIETTASNFDYALISGDNQYNEYKDSGTLIYPTEEWVNYPQVNLPEKVELEMPYITKQKGGCTTSWNFQLGFYATIPVEFTNSGDAPGAGCAAMGAYDKQGNLLDEDLSCWTINPGETETFNYIADISMSDWLSGYYCNAY